MKTCKKGLHTYPKDKKRCPECRRIGKALYFRNNKEQIKFKKDIYNRRNRG